MFFSSLLALANAMSISLFGGASQSFNNVYTSHQSMLGGNVFKYAYPFAYNTYELQKPSSPTEVFKISVTGTGTSSDGETTTSVTYNNFLSLSYWYTELDDDTNAGYWSFDFTSSYASEVAPSLFVNLLIDDNNQGYNFDVSTRVISSVGSPQIATFEFLDAEDYTSLYFHIDIYLVYTTDYDTLSHGTSDDYQAGYNDGYQVGYDNGYNQGKITSDSANYDDAYNRGYADGRNYGYILGLQTTTYSFKDLFGSVADTPILMIRRLFGFELFGTSLMTVFVSLITALIILFIIKKLAKRW